MAFTISMSSRRCPIFSGMGMGHGQSTFTAQCSHTSSAKPALGSVYDDDDEPAEGAAGNGVLLLGTHLEYPAIPNDTAHDGFAVMVTVKAPTLVASCSGRVAPVDLVAVLDISGSMADAKLEHVKHALGFVVDRLAPHDRLSVVAFSDDARRVIRLTRMSKHGKAAAKRAMESLVATGSGPAIFRAGLDEAAKVLGDSWHDNDAAGVILISDGHDYDTASEYSVLVPPFLAPTGGRRPTPVHTFVLGSDNGAAAAMHHISEVTGGTFSFVEDLAAIQDALARCAGGLLSLAVEDVWIEAECNYPGVRITAVKSGRFKSEVKDWGHEAWVSVGDLYADEERRFLVFFDVERADDDNDGGRTENRLMKLSCEYWDMATRQEVTLAGEDPWVMRPLDAGDVAPSMVVKWEIIRVEAAEDIALARAAAERGDYAEAARILDARRESVSLSAPAMSSDATCMALVDVLNELSRRVADEGEYRRTDRACLLAVMSSHAQQRASSVRLSRPMASGLQFGCTGSSVFATPAMRKLERLSMARRERQQEPAPASPVNAGNKIIPRSRLEARLALAVPHLRCTNKLVHEPANRPFSRGFLQNPRKNGLFMSSRASSSSAMLYH